MLIPEIFDKQLTSAALVANVLKIYVIFYFQPGKLRGLLFRVVIIICKIFTVIIIVKTEK